MLGSGLWGLGSDSYGNFSDEYTQNIIKYQISKGITFYDTSDSYGNGRSERLLGNVIEDLNIRDKITIATKVGLLPHKGFFMPSDFSLNYVKKQFNQSLKNLKTNFIDLYQLHSPSRESIYEIQETISWLMKQKSDRKILKIGISARSPSDALFFLDKFELDTIQCNFNLIDQRLIETGLLDFCRDKSIEIIARTPLAFGFLTGKLTSSKDQFTQNDHRRKWPQEQLDLWASAHKEFSMILGNLSFSPLDLAHQFIKYFHPVVFRTICGMHSKEEVDQNYESYYEKSSLDSNSIFKIMKVYESKHFFIKNIKSKGPQ